MKNKSTLKMTLKVFSIVCVVLGVLAIVNSLASYEEDAAYGFIGGVLFLAQGWMTLVYIGENKKVE